MTYYINISILILLVIYYVLRHYKELNKIDYICIGLAIILCLGLIYSTI